MCATMTSPLAKISVILCLLCGFFTAARAMGSSSFGGYTLVERPVRNAVEARHLCASNGQALVNIETEEKFKDITYALKHLDPPMTNSRHDFWTGGFAVPETGRYFWSNGIEIPPFATYWGPGRPVASQTELCITNAFFNATKTWGLNTWDCNDRQNFMCEGDPNGEGNNQDNDDDDENIPFYERYTKVTNMEFTKDEAKNECDKIGKDLVSVQTKKKWEKIKGAITGMGLLGNATPQALFWTAGTQLSGEKRFMWPNHVELPINASYWGPNQPSVFDQHDCISIEVFAGGILGVNAVKCDAKMGYMCERREPIFHPNSSPKFDRKTEWLDFEEEIMAKLKEKYPHKHVQTATIGTQTHSNDTQKLSNYFQKLSNDTQEVTHEIQISTKDMQEASNDTQKVSSETQKVSSEIQKVSSSAPKVSSETQKVSSGTQKVSSETQTLGPKDVIQSLLSGKPFNARSRIIYNIHIY